MSRNFVEFPDQEDEVNILTNVGTTDRAVRGIAGLVLIAAALGLYGPEYASPDDER